MDNIYVEFEGMVYQQIVEIPIGTNCAPLMADLVLYCTILYCYERDLSLNLHKSKQYGLIDMFNDTSRYLGDIFTIDNPQFGEDIPDNWFNHTRWITVVPSTDRPKSVRNRCVFISGGVFVLSIGC